MTNGEVPGSQFKSILDSISLHPDWVKESLYIYLREELKAVSDLNKLSLVNIRDCIYLYVPKLSRAGQMFLESVKSQDTNIDIRLYNFVNSVKMQKNLVDISQDNAWSLKTSCIFVLKAWEKNIILPTYSKIIYAQVRYIAGDIDIGEYLVRIGRITKEQLNWVNKVQQVDMMSSIDDTQTNREEVLINLGYIGADEIYTLKGILKLANTKHFVESQTYTMIMRIKELEKVIIPLKKERLVMKEEKEELQRKVKQLSDEITIQKKEKSEYSKEIEYLKDELKKALKS